MSGRDSEFCGKALDEHRDEVAREYHPEERIPELRSGLDVRSEISRIYIRNARDKRRPEEGENPQEGIFNLFPGKGILRGLNRTLIVGLCCFSSLHRFSKESYLSLSRNAIYATKSKNRLWDNLNYKIPDIFSRIKLELGVNNAL
jgi:hypothetical protein